MTAIEQTSQRIKHGGLIAILRGGFTIEDMLRIGEALLAGGVTIMEVTLNSTHALAALPKLREHFKADMLIGAGTVRDVSQTRQAIEAGAQFIVSPNFDASSATYSLTHDMLHLPGVFTATEVQTAFAAGCRMLKLFPSDMAGPAYLKALRAPLNDIDFVPTGGISLDNIAAYLTGQCVPELDAGKIQVRFNEEGHLDAIAWGELPVTILATASKPDNAATTHVETTAALRDYLSGQFVSHLTPLVEAVRARSGAAGPVGIGGRLLLEQL